MRLGTVIGRVTLTIKDPSYSHGSLLLVQPWTRAQFAAHTGKPIVEAPLPAPLPSGSTVVVFDELGAGPGNVIGFTEGAEAQQPFANGAAIDAYAACIVHQVEYRPPA